MVCQAELSEEQLSCWQQQVDEIQALAAIYEQDFRLLEATGVLSTSTDNPFPNSHSSSSGGEAGPCTSTEDPSAHGSTGGGSQQQQLTPEALLSIERPCSPCWTLDCSLLVHVELPRGQVQVVLQQEQRQREEREQGEALAGLQLQQAQQEQRQEKYPQGQEEAGPQAAPSRQEPNGAAAAAAGSSAGAGCSLQFLPPISMEVCFGPAYPLLAAPEVTLSALWLSAEQAAALEQQLQRLWEDLGPGAPLCYSWADWLQSSALQHLGAEQTLVLGLSRSGISGGGSAEQRDGSAVATAAAAKAAAGASGSAPFGAAAGEGGASAAAQGAAEQTLVNLLRYNAGREHQQFQEQMHTCAICFEEQRGRDFVRLDCRHAFCQACLGEQARLHVAEGSLEALRCPHPGCGCELGPGVLRRLLPTEGFERWEALTLQRTLDTMGDAAWCPRCSTICLEDSDNCAQCPRCSFVFCSLCSEGWHPGTQCVSAETKLAMIRQKMQGGSKASVAALRRQEQELASLAQIEQTSKRCPSCGMAVQKAEGCNKMTCGSCGTFFCYKCGKQISGYGHFQQGECILFDEAEVLRWEQQWDDQVLRAQLAALRNDLVAEADARRNGGRARGCYCPSCGQVNFKMGKNNHMACWACTSHFCYLCRSALRGRGGTHFGPGKCRQHTDN